MVKLELTQGRPISNALSTAGKAVVSTFEPIFQRNESDGGASSDWLSRVVEKPVQARSVIFLEVESIGNITGRAVSSLVDNFGTIPSSVSDLYKQISPSFNSWESIQAKAKELWSKKKELGSILTKLVKYRKILVEMSQTINILNSGTGNGSTMTEVIDNLSKILEKDLEKLEEAFKKIVGERSKSKLILKIAGGGVKGLNKVIDRWNSYRYLFQY